MDCEYELRCKNTDKCYRCFGHSLLSLPEDKQKKKNSSMNRAHNHKEANAVDSWKNLEGDVAAKLNQVPTMKEARRSRMSGALWFEQGDVVDDILHPECKERKGNDLIGGDKSMSIKRDWLEKAKEECATSDKVMALPFRFKGDEDIYCIFDFEDIASLVVSMKAYLLDNDMKSKEIQMLRDRLNQLEAANNV